MTDEAYRRGALSSEANALVELARDGDSPSAEDRARIRRALAAGVAAGVAGSSASAAAASKSVLGAAAGSSAVAGKGSVALWLVAGVVAGLAGSAALFAVVPADRSPGGPAPAVASAPGAHAVAGEPSPSASGTVEAVATPAVATMGAAASGAPSPATPALATTTAVPSSSSPAARAPGLARASTLGVETALLEEARRALGQGDSAGALALLVRHEREFPKGALVEERLAAKVFALCGLGRRAEASRTAARLLDASPNSPLRARVFDSCAYRP